jgi:hypothetical protein
VCKRFAVRVVLSVGVHSLLRWSQRAPILSCVVGNLMCPKRPSKAFNDSLAWIDVFVFVLDVYSVEACRFENFLYVLGLLFPDGRQFWQKEIRHRLWVVLWPETEKDWKRRQGPETLFHEGEFDCWMMRSSEQPKVVDRSFGNARLNQKWKQLFFSILLQNRPKIGINQYILGQYINAQSSLLRE